MANVGAIWSEGSGVFRISVKRGRGTVGVERSGCGEGAPPPKKKNISPQNDMFANGCIFDAVFNRQNTRTITRNLWTRFFTVQSWNEVYKKVQKLYKNSRLDRGGRSHQCPPRIRHWARGLCPGWYIKSVWLNARSHIAFVLLWRWEASVGLPDVGLGLIM